MRSELPLLKSLVSLTGLKTLSANLIKNEIEKNQLFIFDTFFFWYGKTLIYSLLVMTRCK